MKKITNFFRNSPFISGAIVIVIVVIGGYVIYAKSTTKAKDTLTVHSSDFTNELSVSGTVVAAEDVNLGFAESGRVSSVNVKVGDTVSQGQVLASIENGDLEASLQKAEANLESVKEGNRPEDVAVSQAQVASDQSALSQAETSAISSLQNMYSVLDNTLSTDIDGLFTSPQTNPTFGVNIKGSDNTNYYIDGGDLSLTVNGERQAIGTTLLKLNTENQSLVTDQSDANIASTYATAEQALQQTQALISNLSLILSKYSPQDVSAQTIFNSYKSNLAEGSASINTSVSSLNTAITGEKSAESALAKDEQSLTLASAPGTTSDIDAAVADVNNAKALLGKTIVTAPFGGVVTKMDAKVGEIVSPSDEDISMISTGTFQIDAYVPEVDVANVKVGDVATTTLDAYGPNVFFNAAVIAIDPAETVVNGVSNYKTTLQFSNDDPRIKSGMTASIVITTSNVPNSFVIPQGAIFIQNGEHYVQVLDGKKVVNREVTIGSTSSVGQASITSGLNDGDKVILNPNS